MGIIYFIVFLVAVSAVAVYFFVNPPLGTGAFIPKKFLTGNEKEFYHRINNAVGDQFIIAPQVSMGAILDVDLKLKDMSSKYWEIRSKFSSKIIDFLLIDKKTLDPILIIELDDISHDFNKDKKRDAMVARSGLRTVRFWSRNKPTVDQIKQAVFDEINKQKFKG